MSTSEAKQAEAAVLLKTHRQSIDDLDDQIMDLLGKRFAIVREVAQIKAKNGIPSYLSDRVIEVRERNAQKGQSLGIDPEFVRMMYTLMIYQSCAEEDKLMAGHDSD